MNTFLEIHLDDESQDFGPFMTEVVFIQYLCTHSIIANMLIFVKYNDTTTVFGDEGEELS